MTANAVQALLRLYTELGAHNLHRLAEIYSPQVLFIDPLHRIQGLPALEAYFAQLYAEIPPPLFRFQDPLIQADRAFVAWQMQYRHPRLNGGQPISLEGCSQLGFADKVHYHRDYFDAGALLYEQLPLLGALIRHLKRRLAP